MHMEQHVNVVYGLCKREIYQSMKRLTSTRTPTEITRSLAHLFDRIRNDNESNAENTVENQFHI